MQRVVSIHLNGAVYQLEENGYTALFAYLDSTEARLKDSPESAQHLADLEREIAEKCQACLGPHKTVVTSAEVARMLSEMAPAAGQAAPGAPPAASAGNQSSTGSGPGTGENPRTGPPPHQRLWQIREGGMIGGVCLGLATFFHIDVTLVRVLFALFALATGGWGILAYLGLMFILPRATNTAEAATPSAAGTHQWPWDHGWPWGTHGWPWDHPRAGGPPGADWREQRREWREQRRAWRAQRRATRMAYGPSPSLFGTLIIVFFVMLAFGWLTFWLRGGFFGGWPIFWGGPFFWGAPHWVGIVIFFMFFRFLMMPFRAGRWSGYGHPGYTPYDHPDNPWLAMWHGVVWVGTVIFIVWLAYQFVPGVHEFIRQFQTGWPSGRFDV